MGDRPIIGLDVATRTGIAVGVPCGKPLLWSELLGDPQSSHEQRFAQALRLAHRLIREHEPRLVIIERTIKARHDKSGTNELLMGAVACFRGMFYDRGIPVQMAHIGEVDQHFIGGMAPKGQRKKYLADRAAQLGWTFPDQDACDAGALWSLGCARVSTDHATKTLPLFQ